MKKRLRFEETVKRLEDITQMLDGGEIGLDEAVSLYKEGIDLALSCERHIASVEAEVLKLQKTADGLLEAVTWKDAE